MTGATGAMGREAVRHLMEKSDALRLRILVKPDEIKSKLVKQFIRHGVDVIPGDLTDREAVQKGVMGADVVLHIAAIVSPMADSMPLDVLMNVNVGGTQNIVNAIHAVADPKRTRLVYIGSVAQTGSRNPPRHWGRIGDPINISRFDNYAITKTMSEAIVAQSGIEHWVSLRQSGIAHNNLWRVIDPIAFHMPLNGVFEWSTAEDSGRLMAEICGDVPDQLWRSFYNIGGGETSRITNHAFMAALFPNYRKVFQPHWFATRNFHGHWFSDSDVLERLVPYRAYSVRDWLRDLDMHRPWYVSRIMKSFPSLLRKVMTNLAHSEGGPLQWIETHRCDKIQAYFGSRAAWDGLARDWDSFVPFEPSHSPALLNHGYDDECDPEEWALDDLKDAAEYRGGKCLAVTYQGPDIQREWQSAAGHRFSMTPRLYMKGGHWCPRTMIDPSKYDEEASRNPYFSQVFEEQ